MRSIVIITLLFILNPGFAEKLNGINDVKPIIHMSGESFNQEHGNELRGYAVNVKTFTSGTEILPYKSYAFEPNDFDNLTEINENHFINLRPYSLAWNADSTILYGFSRNEEAPYYLISVNPDNGESTKLSPLNGYSSRSSPQGMTIDENNQCYIITTDNADHNTVSSLYKCDLTTGEMSYVGAQSVAPDIHDIAASCDGNMFGINSYTNTLYKIDKSSGEATEVGPLNIGNYSFFNLDFDRKNKKLYHMVWGGRSGYAQIDMQTGQSEFISSSFVTGLLVGAIKSSCSESAVHPSINTSFNGSWFNPEFDGQGFLFEVLPESNTFFAGWFTYGEPHIPSFKTSISGSTDQIWYSLQGPLEEGNAVHLDIKSFQGGAFNQSSQVDSEVVGEMTITFHDCETGVVDYSFFNSRLSGNFPIKRIARDNISLCESMLD